MANTFDKNFTTQTISKIIAPMQSMRTVSKLMNTQAVAGSYNNKSGDKVQIPRPTDWNVIETVDGDITGETESDYTTGFAEAVVQPMLTIYSSVKEIDLALKDGGNPRFFNDMARRIVTTLELRCSRYAMINAGLSVGNIGQGAQKWDDVAAAGSLMESTGVPKDGNWNYILNPYSQRTLAGDVRANLGGETGSMSANSKATLMEDYAGMRVMTGTTLSSYVTGAGAGRSGVVVGTPVATYVSMKDSMKQVIGVSGFQANLVIQAGETVTVVAVQRLNLATREPIVDETGGGVTFTATVNETVTLSAAGAGNLTVVGPAIFEADGAYNTVTNAISPGDTIVLGGAEAKRIQPNLFFHRDAFVFAGVPMEELDATDSFAKTEDGIQLRVSRWADQGRNVNKMRIDVRYALGTLDPFKAGLGYGT